ncbi:Grx4 family monothiol glutaredoxin [Buchnera aphidicola (Macrosiphoniella sanborni)]|uniref:Glutaredoxin n=1 Tax=Buchnera aphidicola (Macrosiphoniella sanborni) TaxID=1241865 RepID=A0A4D6YBA2_9GAMM|nr:Grx4 family monothiol glutaredoxin [Buchnera aphidicola]QCI23741.1 Grx4 family monothiol glutaredoxin [Buchnera aphidicola (Macrosiphoniella sanborni)]
MNIIKKIKDQIKNNIILIYMKGTPTSPSCGFSAQAVQALSACGEKFAYVDVLENTDIRNELPKYANWPTFPQLWVDGELIGGCSIILEMLENGELKKLISEKVKNNRIISEE